MHRHRALIAGAVCAFVALIASSFTSRAPDAAAARQQPRTESAADIDKPPPGRWRLARPDSLEHVVLFFSHILVRHELSPSVEAPFSAADWKTLPPPPKRSHSEARRLAREIAERARRAPEAFDELVERYSEDTLSRPRGGSLGALPASQLVSHSVVLDALATLKPGEVSDVVETVHGFHVLRRSAPPPEQALAGRHIVIGHDSAPWLAYQRRTGPVVSRTRAEARALAQRVKDELERLPDEARLAAFGGKVGELSEHRDAAQGGDLGVWSSREPTHLRWQLDALATLRVGEISEPIETPLGTELVQRIEVTPRARVGMSSIKMRFLAEAAEDHALSRKSVRSRMARIAALIRAEPERFAQWQQQYCCVEPESWSEGRGDPALSALLQELPIGALADQLIEADDQVIIVRRIDPPAAPVVSFDPPEPSEPDLEYLITHASSTGVKRYVQALPAAIVGLLELTDAQRGAIEAAHRSLAEELAVVRSEERVAAFYRAQTSLREQLGGELYDRYLAAVRADVEKLLLRQG